MLPLNSLTREKQLLRIIIFILLFNSTHPSNPKMHTILAKIVLNNFSILRTHWLFSKFLI